MKRLFKQITKRFKLPTSITGRVIQAGSVILGIGAVTTTTVGYFEVTGDTVVDSIIVICTTLIILFGAEFDVKNESDLEKEDEK